jgi:hypothetical protein
MKIEEVLFILLFFLIIGCSKESNKSCENSILNLKSAESNIGSNQLINYFDTAGFKKIYDSIHLSKYEDSHRIPHFLQKSKIDSSRLKFAYYAKGGLWYSPNYQVDLVALIDNDKEEKNILYWLKTYDHNRKEVGHLDFAYWSESDSIVAGGEIDCDTSVHMFIYRINQHRIFKIDEYGNLIFKEQKKLD